MGTICKTMVIKIEWALILAMAVTIWLSLTVSFQDRINTSKDNKELEFNNAIFTEVNTTGPVSQAYAKTGMQKAGVLTLEQVSYKKGGKNEIIANKAIYNKDEVILQGDVKVIQNGGFVYSTQEAVYNPKSKTFTSPTPFVATMGKNTLSGKKLDYDLSKQRGKKPKDHATIFMQDK